MCVRARSYLRVADVTAAAAAHDGVATGNDVDDYVILNGDLSFYAPPDADVEAAGAGDDRGALALGASPRCAVAPWLRALDATHRGAVFVELDASLRARFDHVHACCIPAAAMTSPMTSSPTSDESRARLEVRQTRSLARQSCVVSS